jgi:hypothetical protein
MIDLISQDHAQTAETSSTTGWTLSRVLLAVGPWGPSCSWRCRRSSGF